jgi:hypothetical protein
MMMTDDDESANLLTLLLHFRSQKL